MADQTLARLLGRLPDGFERWQFELAPGEERPSSAAEWSGALVLVERGIVEVHCLLDGRARFVAGDLVALCWLPLVSIRNPGAELLRLVAVRRSALGSDR